MRSKVAKSRSSKNLRKSKNRVGSKRRTRNSRNRVGSKRKTKNSKNRRVSRSKRVKGGSWWFGSSSKKSSGFCGEGDGYEGDDLIQFLLSKLKTEDETYKGALKSYFLIYQRFLPCKKYDLKYDLIRNLFVEIDKLKEIKKKILRKKPYPKKTWENIVRDEREKREAWEQSFELVERELVKKSEEIKDIMPRKITDISILETKPNFLDKDLLEKKLKELQEPSSSYKKILEDLLDPKPENTYLIAIANSLDESPTVLTPEPQKLTKKFKTRSDLFHENQYRLIEITQ